MHQIHVTLTNLLNHVRFWRYLCIAIYTGTMIAIHEWQLYSQLSYKWSAMFTYHLWVCFDMLPKSPVKSCGKLGLNDSVEPGGSTVCCCSFLYSTGVWLHFYCLMCCELLLTIRWLMYWLPYCFHTSPLIAKLIVLDGFLVGGAARVALQFYMDYCMNFNVFSIYL